MDKLSLKKNINLITCFKNIIWQSVEVTGPIVNMEKIEYSNMMTKNSTSKLITTE